MQTLLFETTPTLGETATPAPSVALQRRVLLPCPHCGADLPDVWGRDVVDEPINCLDGTVIRSWRMGNCPACWGVVNLVNNTQLAHVHPLFVRG